MSDTIGNILLNAERILVPYETIAGGKQVSSFVIFSSSGRGLFSLVENEKDVGPVRLSRVDLPDDKLSVWLEERKNECEIIAPKEVRVTEWSFWYDGAVETVIYAIELYGADGRMLRMSRDGAAYPYCLLLHDGAGAM